MERENEKLEASLVTFSEERNSFALNRDQLSEQLGQATNAQAQEESERSKQVFEELEVQLRDIEEQRSAKAQELASILRGSIYCPPLGRAVKWAGQSAKASA